MPSIETPPQVASSEAPLMYFSGMKRLIGEAVSEGIWVDESLRDRALEEGPPVVANENALREVKELQADANSIGGSLKQLKALLSELPTFQPTYQAAPQKQASMDNVLHAHIYFPNVRPFEK